MKSKGILLTLTALVAFWLSGCETTSKRGAPYEKLVGRSSFNATAFQEVVKSPLIPQNLINSYQLRAELEPGGESYWVEVFSPVLDPNVEYFSGSQKLYSETRNGYNQLHFVRLTREEVEQATERELYITVDFGRSEGGIRIWPDLAKAFLEDLESRRTKWAKPSDAMKLAMLERSREMYQTRRDEFKRLTWHDSGVLESASNGIDCKVYSRIEDNGTRYHWVHLESIRGYDKGWAFFEYAIDADGNHLEISKDSDVGYGGRTTEYLHLPVSLSYLENYRTKPLRLRIYGDRATENVSIPAWLIDGYLTILTERLETL